jgi:hypothetical protein
VGGGPLGLGAQCPDGACRVVGAEDRRAGHEHVGAGLGALLDGLLVHAAVDLEPDRGTVLGHQGAGPPQFRQHDVEEVLAAEPGLHRHQQQHVDLGQQVLVRLHCRARVEGEPGAGACGADGAQCPDRGVHRLRVDRHVARAGLGVLRCPAVRIGNHQVAVDRHRGVLEQRLDDGQAECQVRHEVVVHDIHVQPVRDAGDRGSLIGQPGKVRGKDARRDLNAHSEPECRLPGWRPRRRAWAGEGCGEMPAWRGEGRRARRVM